MPAAPEKPLRFLPFPELLVILRKKQVEKYQKPVIIDMIWTEWR
jgi:hypothetical protein